MEGRDSRDDDDDELLAAAARPVDCTSFANGDDDTSHEPGATVTVLGLVNAPAEVNSKAGRIHM